MEKEKNHKHRNDKCHNHHKKEHLRKQLTVIEDDLVLLRAVSTIINSRATGSPTPPFIAFNAIISEGKGLSIVSVNEVDTDVTQDMQLSFGSGSCQSPCPIPLLAATFVQEIVFKFKRPFLSIPAVTATTEIVRVLSDIPGAVYISVVYGVSDVTTTGFTYVTKTQVFAQNLADAIGYELLRLSDPHAQNFLIVGPMKKKHC